jgi:hypothetical protein
MDEPLFKHLQCEENRIILSGTFELRFLKNGHPESISKGRFDMGITDKNFYLQHLLPIFAQNLIYHSYGN